jgi:hypothetical protein
MSRLPIRTARVAVATLFFASIVSAFGCEKSGDKPGEKAAAKSGGCSDKAFKHASPNFCLDVPAGYAATPEKKTNTGMEVNFIRSDEYGFHVSWGRWKTADEALQAYKSPLEKDEKLVEQVDLPGGGYFRHTTADDDHTVVSVVKGKKAFVICFVETKKLDVIAAGVAGCKNIQVD